ncbi:MAG TPA: tetratricopeptide repeat protein [Acidimicrobiales bacterium]|nr:tetratricopeptide repeat protein [Acidimicrobiales bacterium]
MPKYDNAVTPPENSPADAGPAATTAASVEVSKAFSAVMTARIALVERQWELADALRSSGRHNAAVGVANEATHHVRGLFASKPDRYANTLVQALARLARCLEGEKRFEEALSARREAVDLAAQRAPEGVEAKRLYAGSLQFLAWLLEKMGRADQALDPARNSVAVARELLGSGIQAAPRLALSLEALSRLLGGLGRPDESLAPAEEAVQIYASLLSSAPAEVAAKLARAVRQLDRRANEAGQVERLTGPLQGCADQARKLLEDQGVDEAGRAGLSEVLARSLYALSLPPLLAGQFTEALPLLQESVPAFREAVSHGKPGLQEEMAMALNNLGTCLHALGKDQGALALFEETVSLDRQLVGSGNTKLVPRLAAVLQNLAQAQRDAGRHEEALATAEEAVRLCRVPVPDEPGARFALARSLMVLAVTLIGVERASAAVSPSQEAVELGRHLAAGGEAFLRAQLSGSLEVLCVCLLIDSNPEDALAAAQEAVAIERQLCKDHPGTSGPYLALALQSAASCVAAIDGPAAAVPLLDEAVASLRPFVLREPGTLGLALGATLVSLGTALATSDRLEDAVDTYKEAVDVLKHPAVPARRSRDATLSYAFAQLASRLASLGRSDESEVAQEEAEFLYSWSAAAGDAFLKAETFLLNAGALPERGPGFYPSDLGAINRNLFTF